MTTPERAAAYPPPGGSQLGAPPPLRGSVAPSPAVREGGSAARAERRPVAGVAGTDAHVPPVASPGPERPVVAAGSVRVPEAATAVVALLGAALGLALQRRWGR